MPGVCGHSRRCKAFLTDKPSQYVGGFSPTNLPIAAAAHRYARQTNISFFVQDDWRATRRLTVNIGIRDDYITNPIEVRNNFYDALNIDPLTCSNNPGCDGGVPEAGISTGFTNVPHMFKNNPSTRNIDPRIGIAWDIFGDGKTSFRAGYGIFHGLIYPRFYTPGSGFVFPNGTTQLNSPFNPPNVFPTISTTSAGSVAPLSRTKPVY